MITNEIAKKLYISDDGVRERLKKHGIFIKNKSYNDSEIELVSYPKYSNIKSKKLFKHRKVALEIIELYLTEKNNTALAISLKVGETLQKTHWIINHYLKHKEIIIESKLNEL